MASTILRKTALVTGSTSGVGLAIAKAYAKNGFNVVTSGFGSVDEAITDIRSVAEGGRVEYVGCDLSHASEIEQMMQESATLFGGVDVLINNAGIQHVAPIDEFPVDKWDTMMAVNLSAAFHTTRLALPHMKQNNWGRVINIASTHGLVGSANKSAYVAAKHGIIGMTKAVALETATTGITCNALCPGWVLTPLVQAQVDARAEAQGLTDAQAKADLLSEKQPSQTFVSPEQVASLTMFLSSNEASEVRGVAWNMDGGWTAQ